MSVSFFYIQFVRYTGLVLCNRYVCPRTAPSYYGQITDRKSGFGGKSPLGRYCKQSCEIWGQGPEITPTAPWPSRITLRRTPINKTPIMVNLSLRIGLWQWPTCCLEWPGQAKNIWVGCGTTDLPISQHTRGWAVAFAIRTRSPNAL